MSHAVSLVGAGRAPALRRRQDPVDVARIVAFREMACLVSPGTIDHQTALHGRAPRDRIGPTDDVAVLVHGQELAGAIQRSLDQPALPRPDRHVGDGVVVA